MWSQFSRHLREFLGLQDSEGNDHQAQLEGSHELAYELNTKTFPTVPAFFSPVFYGSVPGRFQLPED